MRVVSVECELVVLRRDVRVCTPSAEHYCWLNKLFRWYMLASLTRALNFVAISEGTQIWGYYDNGCFHHLSHAFDQDATHPLCLEACPSVRSGHTRELNGSHGYEGWCRSRRFARTSTWHRPGGGHRASGLVGIGVEALCYLTKRARVCTNYTA